MPKIENESAEQNVSIIWPVLFKHQIIWTEWKTSLKKPLNVTIQNFPIFAAGKTGPLSNCAILISPMNLDNTVYF